MAKAKQARRSRLAFPIGLIAVILAVVGGVTVVKYIAASVQRITDDSSKKAYYEEYLKPVVMFDPDTFDDISQASVPQLVNSAIWALLMDESGADRYEYSEGNQVGILIPQNEVEQKFVSLFGTEIDIASKHSTVDMSEYDISYDAAKKSYIIPITGVDSAYTPKVYDINKKGSSVILTVGYIGSEAWVQIESGEYVAPEPDKFMKITMRESTNGMYIAAIQTVDGQEVAIATTMRSEETTAAETTAAQPVTTSAVQTTAEPETDEDGSVINDTTDESETTEQDETDEESTTEEE